jgi:fermentation-respiration switch protein FrsA (DUF1100 family)
LFHAEDAHFDSADGTSLHGWYFEHPQPRAHLLYCHGNGDCVGYLGSYLSRLSKEQQLSIFVFDYRGYGRSAGSPHEQGILQDGIAAREWLAQRAGIPPADVVLMGRSLGGGVAVDLAANGGAKGLVLQNTFTSLPDVAARMYWFLPVRLLMKNQYRSIDKIGKFNGPLLQSHGTKDSIVPFEIGHNLFTAAPGWKELFTIPGGDHNDSEPTEYAARLEAFLKGLRKT